MKKILFPILSLLFCINMSCKSGGKKPKENGGGPKSAVDSLLSIIDKGHMDGMGKIGRLHTTRKAVQATLDSLDKLSSAPKGYMDELRSVIKDIDYADFAMDKWMTEYNEDSSIDNIDQHIRYLQGETQKVESMSAAIRNSIQKADSLLKVKF